MSGFKDFQRRFDGRAAFKRFQQVRVTFLEDLAVTLKGGSNLIKAIGESAERCEDPLQALVYRDIRDQLSNGQKLPVAMGSWFEPSERMLLEAFLEGARTNENIGEALSNMVKVIRPYEELRRARMRLLTIMVFVFIGSIGAVGITGYALVSLKGALPVSKWPGWVLSVVDTVEWIAQFWPVLAAMAVAGPLVFIRVLNRWTGPVRRSWDRKVPGFAVYRETHGSLVMIALGAYSAAGRGVGETCRALSANASPWLRSYLSLIQHRAQKEKNADIVDVGLFDWRLMVRIACLSSGAGLSAALRSVGLESSDVVARQLLARMQVAQLATQNVLKVVFFGCLFVVLTMYFAMVSNVFQLNR